jgi:hypothetical protein
MSDDERPPPPPPPGLQSLPGLPGLQRLPGSQRSVGDLPVAQLLDELWPSTLPPPDFAARVLAAHRSRGAESVPDRRRSKRWWPWGISLGAGVALAATALLLVLMKSDGRSGSAMRSDGHITADERQEVRIDERALAVVEKGSEIAWSARGDGLRVDQRRGDVFYRVDRGDAFLVVTPAGEIEVTGTCFRVVVDESGDRETIPRMRVEVMEGSLEARSGPSEITLGAGEQAQLSPDEILLRNDRTTATSTAVDLAVNSSELRAQERASRRRALDAEARVRQLERALALQPRAGPSLADASGMPPRRKTFNFTSEERAAMARHCQFRWGLPRHLTQWATPDFDKRLVLDASEREAIVRVMEEQRTQFVEQLRAIFMEVVGDARAAQTLSPRALHHEIDSKSRSADGKEARQTILLEWAGRRAPPADLGKRPPLERFWRLLVGSSDEFLRSLQPIIGSDRARELAVELVDMGVYGRERGCPSGQ